MENYVFGLGEGVDQFYYLLQEHQREKFGQMDQQGTGKSVEDVKPEDSQASAPGPQVPQQEDPQPGPSHSASPDKKQESTEVLMESLSLPKEKLDEIREQTLQNLQAIGNIHDVGRVQVPKKRAKTTEANDSKMPKFTHNVKLS